MTTPESLPLSARVSWRPCFRIIPSRFPPIQLFERVADPADLEAVFAVEGMTNLRLRNEVGDLSLVAPDERVTGPGSSWLMAPFTHVSGQGGRFSTAHFGAYYAARRLDTAIAETRYHRARFLRATSEPPIDLDMRVLEATLTGTLHDVRGQQAEQPALYHRDDYGASQALATALRLAGSRGVLYDSVRHDTGECVAAFTPKVLSRCRQTRNLTYRWNGQTIDAIYEKRAVSK